MDQSTKKSHSQVARAVGFGLAAHCPFCRARVQRTPPPAGTRIIFLATSLDVGHVGTVQSEPFEPERGNFLVRMDHDRQGWTRTVRADLDLFIDVKAMTVPAWMPSVSIEDSQALHDSMMIGLAEPGSLKPDNLYGLIATCWWRRLPLSPDEIWPMIGAHGGGQHVQRVFFRYFEFGRSLLVSQNGRKPNKRRRMPPMSEGRYLTAHEKEMRLKIFGYW